MTARPVRFSPLAAALAALREPPIPRSARAACGTAGPAVSGTTRGSSVPRNATSARVALLRVARPAVPTTTTAARFRRAAAERAAEPAQEEG